MPWAAVGGILTGGAAIAGLFGKKQSSQSQSSTTPSFSPEQQQLQAALGSRIQSQLDNPANLDPLKTAAVSSVNRNYDTLQSNLDRTLAARGFGSSGKAVTGAKSLAIAREGTLGNLQSQFAALQTDQNNQAIDRAQRFAFASPGSTSTGTQSGTQGGGAGGAVGGAAETASLLYALNHFLGGGGPKIDIGKGIDSGSYGPTVESEFGGG